MGDAFGVATSTSLPHLISTPNGWQLFVHGKPSLILGAELQNSSFSCPEHMQSVWEKLKAFNLNTVLANVGWEAIEPSEGVFDFSRFDQVVLDARHNGFHLIILWFGAFKNAKSTYTPSWVKTNSNRFPRAHLRQARGQTRVADTLSLFNSEIMTADARAFATLMRHIKDIDERDNTIIMVQVENEAGLLGDSRDGSSGANQHFHGDVPEDLLTSLSQTWDQLHPSLTKNLETFRDRMHNKTTGSWPETFGNSAQTDELFMAYNFASYVEQVTKAGKAEYQLPMFTNVWQNYADDDADKSQPTVVGGGGEPGDYPSGGGVINVLDIWQNFAPSLDFIAPDLYLNDYNAVCKKYRHRGQALFIPEQRRDEYGARRIWSAYGTHHALCASPFAIDTMELVDNPWTKHYGLLKQVSQHLLTAQAEGRDTFGFFFDEYVPGTTVDDMIKVQLGDWNLSVERSFVFGKPGPGFGIIIQLAAAKFMLVGEGFQVKFASANKASVFTGILSLVEKICDHHTGDLRDGRILNGDETRTGEQAIMPNASPDYGDFPIIITVPAKTRIAECEVYALV